MARQGQPLGCVIAGVDGNSVFKENRTANEKPQQGTVLVVGKGKVNDDGKRVPLDVKVGDRILFGKYAGQEIKLDGEEYFIMKEDDVMAVIEGHTQKKLAAIKGKTNKKK